MSTLSEIRTGLAANLAAIDGLRTHAYVPDDISPPVAVVVPSRVTYDTAFGRGSDETTFSVLVIVARASERAAQDALDGYCDSAGATSVKAAIEADRTLGGAALDCRVTELSDIGPFTAGETAYLAATFAVQIITN